MSNIRTILAEVKAGINLEHHINSENYVIRAAVAQQGYGLEKLVNDVDYSVRIKVAQQGYGLDKLINDTDWNVRLEVVKQGFGHEQILSNAENENVIVLKAIPSYDSNSWSDYLQHNYMPT